MKWIYVVFIRDADISERRMEQSEWVNLLLFFLLCRSNVVAFSCRPVSDAQQLQGAERRVKTCFG